MDADDKRLILAEHLDRFRKWSYATLAAEVDRTRMAHDCLATLDGLFDDGTEYHLEFNVFWDDRRGGNVRVCGDITTPPQAPFRPILPIQTPDATDSFIMAQDGRFIGE
jgi:hypothetical protein